MGEKRRVSGTVDRIENGIVVVVIRDPNDPESSREVFVPREKIKKVDLEPGDRVTILI